MEYVGFLIGMALTLCVPVFFIWLIYFFVKKIILFKYTLDKEKKKR